MRKSQISLRASLIVVAVVAVWFSSFHLGIFGYELRHCFRFMLLAVPLLWLVPHRSSMHAWCTGFLVAAVPVALRQAVTPFPSGAITSFLFSNVPAFYVAEEVARFYDRSQTSYAFMTIRDSLGMLLTLAFASLTGFIAVRLYYAQQHSSNARSFE